MEQSVRSGLLGRGRSSAQLHASLLEGGPYRFGALRLHQRAGGGSLEPLKVWAEVGRPQERLQNLAALHLQEQHLGQRRVSPVFGPALDQRGDPVWKRL